MKKMMLFAALLSAATHPLHAQTCVGTPIKAGSLAIGAGIAFPEAAKSYHVSVDDNTSGKLLWNATGGITHLDDVDTNQKDIAASVGFKPISAPLTICPRVEAGYSWWKYEAGGGAIDLKLTYATLGFGVGYEIPTGSSMTIGLFAKPALLVQHTSASIADPGYFDSSDTDNKTAFASHIGATLAAGRIYVTGFASLTSLPDSKTVFGVNAGFAVR